MPRLLFSGHRWIVTTNVDQAFSRISTLNLECHSTWNLCPSTKYTTFTFGEFEVFRWNLENAAKVLGDIRGSKGVQGVWLGFWPNLDHYLTKGCHWGLSVMFLRWWPRLTVVWPKSTRLTGSLGLNNPTENLGRHRMPGIQNECYQSHSILTFTYIQKNIWTISSKHLIYL
jgi:hypothetical protein